MSGDDVTTAPSCSPTCFVFYFLYFHVRFKVSFHEEQIFAIRLIAHIIDTIQNSQVWKIVKFLISRLKSDQVFSRTSFEVTGIFQ